MRKLRFEELEGPVGGSTFRISRQQSTKSQNLNLKTSTTHNLKKSQNRLRRGGERYIREQAERGGVAQEDAGHPALPHTCKCSSCTYIAQQQHHPLGLSLDEGSAASLLGVGEAHHHAVAQPPGQRSQGAVHQHYLIPVFLRLVLVEREKRTRSKRLHETVTYM